MTRGTKATMNFSFPVRTEPQSPGLSISRETEYSGPDAAEYRAVIRNESDVPVFLRAAVLLDTQDLTALGLGGGPYRVFWSGRHKNDMPGVFQTGCPDQRLADVASVMAEQGGSMEAGESRRVVSDHLTLIEQDGVCLAQAYYRAVKAIRDGMGEDGFLLICGGLYDPAIGLADAQRTGADGAVYVAKQRAAGRKNRALHHPAKHPARLYERLVGQRPRRPDNPGKPRNEAGAAPDAGTADG